jgi:arylsulfatase A-like enzyme
LLDLTETKAPESFPGREITPHAGVSLAPVLAGKPLGTRPPIHLHFGQDRGLRDGDWKIVSFRSGPWELYHLGDDRTELNDLASREPERVKRMAAEWHRITRDVLKAPRQEQQPVAENEKPQIHPEWSDYSGKRGSNTSRRAR